MEKHGKGFVTMVEQEVFSSSVYSVCNVRTFLTLESTSDTVA